jgi:hypothetical protein
MECSALDPQDLAATSRRASHGKEQTGKGSHSSSVWSNLMSMDILRKERGGGIGDQIIAQPKAVLMVERGFDNRRAMALITVVCHGVITSIVVFIAINLPLSNHCAGASISPNKPPIFRDRDQISEWSLSHDSMNGATLQSLIDCENSVCL